MRYRFLLLLLIVLNPIAVYARTNKPRIIVCTDINNAKGDPDDKQSLGHLLMYADEVEIRAIIPDRWNAGGVAASLEVIAAYESDYRNPGYSFQSLGFPTPEVVRQLVLRNNEVAVARIIDEAQRPDERPLWILVWGNMGTVRRALKTNPGIATKIRLFTIGTNVRADNCELPNWNGAGRNDIFNDERFKDLWWVESDWTYAGMFLGPEPRDMLEHIAQFGALGKYIKDVVMPHKWAHYFRVGDTPSLLYLLDPHIDLDDPTQASWAGRYVQPFPDRPHYYTGIDGGYEWDYAQPCKTWQNAKQVEQARKQTLLDKRNEMYASYLHKIQRLYGKPSVPPLSGTAALPPGHPRLQITKTQPKPVIVHVGAVDHHILALEIEAQRVQRSAVQAYEPLPEDRTKINEQHGVVRSVELIRDGKPVAYLAGKERKQVWFFEELIGKTLNTDKADAPETYTLATADRAIRHKPLAVYRKSKPINTAHPAKTFAKRHTLYLKLPVSLQEDETYTLRLPDLGLNVPEISFCFNSQTKRSEAIHVCHIGFRPNDPVKQAHLSVWLGNGGAHAYQDNLPFTLIDQDTGKIVFRGVVEKNWPADKPESMKRKQNHNLTDVSLIDFSSFTAPGTYRISVGGIGCSYPFAINESIWHQPFQTAMKGFYHQRSGIALEKPYTHFTRPRPYHPDDGLAVLASDVTLMETRNGLNLLKQADNFEGLNANVTGERVEGLWGGYFDAADWDRRIQHLIPSRFHLELLELFPAYFRDLDLNLPESKNPLPDILDEALFNIDCYRRLQTAEGGIRGGIETSAHPVQGETSWMESLRVMTYAPGPWSSYYYANVAARAALLLRTYDGRRTQTLQKSALAAWDWAEAHVATFAKSYSKDSRWNNVIDERNLAALEFYRLTGESKWHDIFQEDSILKVTNAAKRYPNRQRHAAFLYARLPDELGQAALQQAAKKMILDDATTALAYAQGNAWGLASSHPSGSVGTGWFSTPDLIPLMRAHYLTGQADYFTAIVRSIQFSLGDNPMNMTYTTGVGHEWPRNAMCLDSRRTARAAPVGITVFGQVDYNDAKKRNNTWQLGALNWYLVRKKAITPDPYTWPVIESYWDIFYWPSACEFTPQRTMGNVSYMWGYLAAQE